MAGVQAVDEVGKETMRCRRSTPTKRAVAASEAACTSCTIPPVLSHRLTPSPPLSPPSSLPLSPPRSLRVERHAQLVKIQAPIVLRTVRRNALRVSTARDINRQRGHYDLSYYIYHIYNLSCCGPCRGVCCGSQPSKTSTVRWDVGNTVGAASRARMLGFGFL